MFWRLNKKWQVTILGVVLGTVGYGIINTLTSYIMVSGFAYKQAVNDCLWVMCGVLCSVLGFTVAEHHNKINKNERP